MKSNVVQEQAKFDQTIRLVEEFRPRNARKVRKGIAGEVSRLAVVSGTGYGFGGTYPVYATIKDGRVLKLEIVFA